MNENYSSHNVVRVLNELEYFRAIKGPIGMDIGHTM